MQAAGEGDQQNKTTKTPLSVKNNQNEMTVTWVWIMNTHHYFNAKIMILEESRFSFLGYFNGDMNRIRSKMFICSEADAESTVPILNHLTNYYLFLIINS